MSQMNDDTIENLIASVDCCLKGAEAAGLDQTAALLRMVKIDLITRANGVTGDELEAFLFVLESELRIAEYERQAEPKENDQQNGSPSSARC